MARKPGKKPSLRKKLVEMTKNQLYGLAKNLGIAGRSRLTKTELVEQLQSKKDVESMIDSPVIKETVTKSKSAKKTPVMKKPDVPPTPIQIASMPEPATTVESSTPVTPAAEPDRVWHGEEGPELPSHYGRTFMYAMPRDPNWVYMYWEIADDARRAIENREGAWIFDVSNSVIRVLDENEDISQEVPIMLDAMHWYLCLPANKEYRFELGLKDGDRFVLIARSNSVVLPAAQPSHEMDEEWAMVEERFAEMLHSAATGENLSSRSSMTVMPHLFRHRINLPWDISYPYDVPSSHVLAGGASEMLSSGALSSRSQVKKS